MNYQQLSYHQYSDECDCSLCDQFAEQNGLYEDEDHECHEHNEVACSHTCQCCEEVVVPEDYKAAPTEIVGGSSYICGGRRVKKVKRRRHRGKGLLNLTRAKGYKKKGGNVIGGKRRRRRHHKGGASMGGSYIGGAKRGLLPELLKGTTIKIL